MSTASRTLYVAEPSPGYLLRPPLVIDCSVLCGILFDEPWRTEAVEHVAGKALHAPYLLDHEVLSVTLKKHRQQWSPDSIRKAMEDYAQYAVELHESDLAGQLDLALRYQLSAYDAAYLWLAAELKAPLATFDKALATAAQAHLRSLP